MARFQENDPQSVPCGMSVIVAFSCHIFRHSCARLDRIWNYVSIVTPCVYVSHKEMYSWLHARYTLHIIAETSVTQITIQMGGAFMIGANSVTISTFDIGKQFPCAPWSASTLSKQQSYGHLRGRIISSQSHKKV